MQINNVTEEQMQGYQNTLINHIQQTYDMQWIKYLNLGTHVVRLINYSKEFTPIIEKHLTYVLKNDSSKYDSTMIIWKEDSVKSLAIKLNQSFNTETGIISAYDQNNNIYYYGAENLAPEEFIKQGHIFVQIFNKILKTPKTALVHGAVVGLDNRGILFCARGHRGKSTLAVSSMLRGFEYVSDDYLTLCPENGSLYAYPIYSIITLSPHMYNELYDELDGKFVSNNARKDKYVINIAKHHDKFKEKYPISICMFPQIVNDTKPSIVPCGKGRAITQLIHSTINQMQDTYDTATVKKLISFVENFDFYQINLCPDIWANVEYLREFMENLNNKEKINDELCVK